MIVAANALSAMGSPMLVSANHIGPSIKPATPASSAARIQDSASRRLTLRPISRAALISCATVRIPMPSEVRKNRSHSSATIKAVTITTATAWAEIVAPAIMKFTPSTGDGSRNGQEPNASSAAFCMVMPIATVPMMIVTTGLVRSGRYSTAKNRTPNSAIASRAAP
ncbi:hypothetical protein AXW67_00050 [Bradyrhizobium neotropicale]|uniref:Uncharacterized protein n=1 Tax=Bradyrhizobium neotropicale TaxID=1497615 RepID=A0A176ZAL5_9BRAD|nr:hypothetical protein AXW67_00050 [Bradyrhizobium neotropicale]